jgi:hypothetical protein
MRGSAPGRKGESERRAGSHFALSGHLPTVRFDKGLHDGETKPQTPAACRIGFPFLEDFREKVRLDSSAVVGDPGKGGALSVQLARTDDHSPCGVYLIAFAIRF